MVVKELQEMEVMTMPLSMFSSGESGVINRISGRDDTKRFLNNLGFVEGGTITVVNKVQGNIIVHVMDSRVAIGKSMANKIMVERN